MMGVYRWMTLGLAVTALVAYSVATSEAALQLVIGNRFVFFGLVIAELGLVITLTATANRLSAATAGGLFLLKQASHPARRERAPARQARVNAVRGSPARDGAG